MYESRAARPPSSGVLRQELRADLRGRADGLVGKLKSTSFKIADEVELQAKMVDDLTEDFAHTQARLKKLRIRILTTETRRTSFTLGLSLYCLLVLRRWQQGSTRPRQVPREHIREPWARSCLAPCAPAEG